MRTHLRHGYECFAALSALAMACGDAAGSSDDPPEDAAVDAQTSVPDSDVPVADASTTTDAAVVADSATTAPQHAATCTAGQLRCRGVCFEAEGQSSDGCDVLFFRRGNLESVERAFITDTHAFVMTRRSTDSSFDIQHVALDSGDVTTVQERVSFGYDAQVYGDSLYFFGAQSPSAPGTMLMRLAADGSFAEASGMLSAYSSSPFLIADDSVYQFEQKAGSSRGNIYRIALGAKRDSHFLPNTTPGAELVAEDVYAGALASDGDYFYFASDIASGGLSRVRLGDPGSLTLLNDEVNFAIAQQIAVPASAPGKVFFQVFDLYSVPRSGGPLLQELKFYAPLSWLGRASLLTYGASDDSDSALRAYPYAAPAVSVVDSDGSKLLTAWDAATAYYAASANGLVRIAKP